ncbi:hypothetical protein OSB04_014055 [Centaurea solstitialis]|uniref:Uncharacterized protein n=1 Tax=Centaurea solstitialis TaxID=347529 RepID=A0AA38TSB0_9ASTR|nr:hypothetical protein OSB04_014055 [Centaurea solstitialis]
MGDVDSNKFHKIIDPRLKGNYPLESVNRLSTIADRCLSKDPKSRPKMSMVLEMVNQLIAEVQETVSPLQAQVANPAPLPPPEGPSLVRVVSIMLKKVLMCSTKYETTREG